MKAEWITKEYPYVCCAHDSLEIKRLIQMYRKEQKKIFHANENKKAKAEAAILAPDKIGIRDKINKLAEQKQTYTYKEHIDGCHLQEVLGDWMRKMKDLEIQIQKYRILMAM